ncbi:hypothetical protein B296_00015804, partial [Ensete ventricosum]
NPARAYQNSHESQSIQGDSIVRLRTADRDRLYYPSWRALRGQIASNPRGFGKALGFRGYFLSSSMATETKPVAAEDPKVDLFEDDDEFEEFEFGEGKIRPRAVIARGLRALFLPREETERLPAQGERSRRRRRRCVGDARGSRALFLPREETERLPVRGERSRRQWDEKEEGKETGQQWEDDWDDDDVNDDFSVQLKKELESSTEKS